MAGDFRCVDKCHVTRPSKLMRYARVIFIWEEYHAIDGHSGKSGGRLTSKSIAVFPSAKALV